LESRATHLTDHTRVLERELAVAGQIADFRSFHDGLTALPNRALLLDRLTQALARRTGREGAVAVLSLDLDRFRTVNDSLGRSAGDAVLVAVADRLTLAIRPGDTVARIGGDEFVVVAEGLFGVEEATVLAERIRLALAEPFALRRGDTVSISASIGIVAAQSGTAEEALRDADAALYRAKERGHNRCEYFTGEIRTEAVHRLGTEWMLRHALEDGGVAVHYQPIVDLTSATAVGGEALLRIRTVNGDVLLPGEFLLAEACRQFEHWRVDHPELARLSVNVDLRQLTDPAALAGLEQAVATSGLEPRHVCVELPESSLVESGPATRAALDRLTGDGFGLGIDDFGT